MEQQAPIPVLEGKLTPRQIVEALDEYIVGQEEAKRAVAVALRNRIRRQMLPPEMQEEVTPKNILMIGPTGVGKTEIARRLARLVRAPFIKVEASKFTEVGYVGRDVESIIRDLTEAAVAMVRQELQEEMREQAEARVEERILDALLPDGSKSRSGGGLIELLGLGEREEPSEEPHEERHQRIRERFREKLRAGELEDRPIEIEVEVRTMPFIEILTPGGHEEMDINLRDLLGNMLPKQRRRRRVTVAEARRILLEEEMERLTDMDRVVPEAIRRVEQAGIVFLDELDKIAGREGGVGPDVSREGVQRDILPIVEGCTVTTKYGPVRTDHILFIAAGAFHVAKPSDLIPELQGRFPIRVELHSLTEEDFRRILTDPKNSLIRQYAALLATEGVTLEFTDDAIEEIARVAHELNSRMENIGARRLHTILERVLEPISFSAPERAGERVVIDRQYVREQLRDVLGDVDLSRYIL